MPFPLQSLVLYNHGLQARVGQGLALGVQPLPSGAPYQFQSYYLDPLLFTAPGWDFLLFFKNQCKPLVGVVVHTYLDP